MVKYHAPHTGAQNGAQPQPPAPDGQTFDFSRFDGKNDNVPKAARLDWKGVRVLLSNRRLTQRNDAAAKDGPLFSGASYQDGATRGNAGVARVSLAILDFDGGAQIPAIEASVSRLNDGNGAAAILYSTFSHNPKAGAHKYRLVIPLLNPVSGADYPDVWKRLAQAFDGAPDAKAKDAARIHYLPSCPKSRETDAVLLDWTGEPLDVQTLPELPAEAPKMPYTAPESRGGDAYARRAFDAEIRRLCTTSAGRNSALNEIARRLGQFVGAGRLDRSEVEAALMSAASANGYISKDGEAEARATMKSGLDAGEREPNHKGEPDARPGANRVPGQSSPTSATPTDTSNGEEATPAAARRWTFTSLRDLRARPRPKWLIRDVLIESTAVVLSGDSQSFKTFSALDMALCVATGTDWHGREVMRGSVVYIAAEGGWTLRDRLEAWEIARQIEAPENFHLLEVPVSIGEAATVVEFSAFIEATAPRLVVIDTLSACAEGLKENASEDMATFVRHMKAIARATGATVVVIHHNNKGGDLRGAVSLKNDADTHITFERVGDETELTTLVSCSKNRVVHFPKFSLRGERIELSEPDEYGRPVTSLVFEECDRPEGEKEAHPNAKKADATRAQLLEIFDEIAAEFDGVKAGTWSARTKEAGICGDSAFWRHRSALVKDGTILTCGDVYRRSTPTTPTTPKSSYGSSGTTPVTSTPTTPTHPLGVGVVGVGVEVGKGSGSGSAPKPYQRRQKNSPDSEPYGAAATQPAEASSAEEVDEF